MTRNADKGEHALRTFEDLAGNTLSSIENKNDKEIVFTLESGEKYRLYHDQHCCESVTVEDICGDLSDLVGSPILLAEEIESNNVNPDGVPIPGNQGSWSFTWTFYKLVTNLGAVTIRWYGKSNGHYSERVYWGKVS